MRRITSPPWARGGLRITRAALDEVERFAIAGHAAGEEVCGVLSGPAADPLLCDAARAIPNIARDLHERDPQNFFHTARTFFAFYARTLESVIDEAEDAGRAVKVLYHSHLDADARLSATDAAVLSGGLAPLGPGGSAQLGPGPAWPLAFMVTSVVGAERDVAVVNDHRLYVWAGESFEASSFEVHLTPPTQ